jgi:hypothetical protein
MSYLRATWPVGSQLPNRSFRYAENASAFALKCWNESPSEFSTFVTTTRVTRFPMPAIRRKDASIAKIPQIKKNGEDYDDAILKLKTTLKITPKTAKHLCMFPVRV